MIRPKHSFARQKFVITEDFVDRYEAKELYRNKLLHNRNQYNLLSFYGIGGIGKSRLRRELCRIHEEENTQGITFCLDLNSADDRNLGTGILKLVDSCNTKIDFKCFWMAYALYFRRKHPGMLFGRDNSKLKEKPFIGIGIDIISVFDNGITGTAAEIIESVFRTISNRSIDKEVKEELKHFDDYSLEDMEERLPLFFQYDLHSYLMKHKEAKVLMVFDTFEALNENVIDQIHRIKNERWIQMIIEYFDSEFFPDLLILIFGRERIEWGSEWDALIEQYQLTELSEEYSAEYLKHTGIKDQAIVQAIIRSSKGYPFLLYLLAQTYANMICSGKAPEARDFNGSYPEIIERFIYNLDKDTVEVLQLLSIPNYYDTDLFNHLIMDFNVSFPLAEYEQFNKYSFVSYNEREGRYHIHDLMRRGIRDYTSDQVVLSVHQNLLHYFAGRISGELITKDIIELFYHAKSGLSTDEFNQWLVNPLGNVQSMVPLSLMKHMQKGGEQSTLIQIINGILARFDISELLIDVVNIYVDIVHLGGDYERAVQICEEYLDHFSEKDIREDEQLIKMRIRKIHHSMFFSPVDRLIQEAEELLDGIDITRFPEEYNELLFLIGGNLGVLAGNLDRASEWLEMSMAYAQKHHLESFVHRTIRKQADILLATDQVEEAIELISRVVSIQTPEEQIDSRYKIYLSATLGECYRKLGNCEYAWACYDIVDKKAAERHMPGWLAHALLAKGMCKIHQKEYMNAKELFNQSLSVYSKINQTWGIINAKEALLLLDKAETGLFSQDDARICRIESERMNYRYNITFIDRLTSEEMPYFQLFFL